MIEMFYKCDGRVEKEIRGRSLRRRNGCCGEKRSVRKKRRKNGETVGPDNELAREDEA